MVSPCVPICIVIRETHTHARGQQPVRDRALADVALGPALMSHDCIQIPEFFPRVRSVAARCARWRTPPRVSLSRFLPAMEMTARTGHSEGTTDRELRVSLLCTRSSLVGIRCTLYRLHDGMVSWIRIDGKL